MTTFALAHGSWHRGDCWEPTAAMLRAAGHDVVAPDLPCDDPAAGLEDHAGVVIDAIAQRHPSDDVVVVGHSMGGLIIPLIAEAVPVRELVFLCAFVPLPGASARDDLYQLEDTFTDEWPALSSHLQQHPDRSTSWPTGPAIEALYHDCEPALAAAAAGRLRRQARTVAEQPSPLLAYPDVPARAIVCDGDRVLNADSCARHARERLGATVLHLDGGHSPMLAQPAALTHALLEG